MADGINSPVRQNNRLCLLIIISLTKHGCKKLVAVEDSYLELEARNLAELFNRLLARGLTISPRGFLRGETVP
ncbi:MAG: hypothetical protein ACTS73_04755 [Arsenophonus sp. NEOnobi-MAG3]